MSTREGMHTKAHSLFKSDGSPTFAKIAHAHQGQAANGLLQLIIHVACLWALRDCCAVCCHAGSRTPAHADHTTGGGGDRPARLWSMLKLQLHQETVIKAGLCLNALLCSHPCKSHELGHEILLIAFLRTCSQGQAQSQVLAHPALGAAP